MPLTMQTLPSTDFATDARVALPALAHADGCRCALHARRRLGGALIGGGALAVLGLSPPASAQPAQSAQSALAGQCKLSGFTKFVSADQIEQAAGQQYRQMLQQAAAQRGLAPADHPQLQRLRYIAKRMIPLTSGCNPRSQQWRWDVNLIGSPELNAFCMPGGKIAFYLGILSKLKLDDDEVATIMGHEVAHALLEHSRENFAKTAATRGGIEILSALVGLGGAGTAIANMGGQLLTMKFSRGNESEADALGLALSASAGYRPEAGVSLWQKMLAASKGAPPQFLSTHPSGESRIKDIQARLPGLEPVYADAAKPDRRFSPPTA
jgi:predicted Zn-dependent protease